MTLGQKIKSQRLRLGITQNQLAETTGIHQTTISDIENGNVEWPRGNTITKLADVLRVTTDYLLREKEPETSFVPIADAAKDCLQQILLRKLKAEIRRENKQLVKAQTSGQPTKKILGNILRLHREEVAIKDDHRT